MPTSKLDKLFHPVAARLHRDHMSRLGIAKTMRIAHAYNRLKFGRTDNWRRKMYREHFDELVQENGPLVRPRVQMNDGWALDTSMTLPHLDRVLNDSREIISERAGQRLPGEVYRSYFQDVWTPQDVEKYPSIMDFTTSSDVIAVAADYLQCIPALSTTLPPGIRFVESNAAFDQQPDAPHDSQLFHIDYYSLPNFYVIVLLEDTTSAHGPWTFLPKSVSKRVATQLGYWGKSRGYRVSDEEMYSVVDRKEVIEFTGKRGSVLFIESSGCFHYGSRNSIKPRFQLMIGFNGVCRTDFSEVVMTPQVHPTTDSDSRLRKMVLNKHFKG